MNSFDNRLPKTTTYWRENGVFFIKHTSFSITQEENKAIQELVRYADNDRLTKAVVFDNREARGVWPKFIGDASNNENANYSFKKKSATLTGSHTAALQMNRIAKETGLYDVSRGFYSDFNDDVKAFLGVK